MVRPSTGMDNDCMRTLPSNWPGCVMRRKHKVHGSLVFILVRQYSVHLYKEKELILPLYKTIVRLHLEYCM